MVLVKKDEETKPVWEDAGPGLERIAVPGGWLYALTKWPGQLTFVNDPEYCDQSSKDFLKRNDELIGMIQARDASKQ